MKTRTSKITSKNPRKTAQNPAKPAAEAKPLAATVPVEPTRVSQTEKLQVKPWSELTREERAREVDKMFERLDWENYNYMNWHLLLYDLPETIPEKPETVPESEVRAAEGVPESNQPATESATESAANELPASPVLTTPGQIDVTLKFTQAPHSQAIKGNLIRFVIEQGGLSVEVFLKEMEFRKILDIDAVARHGWVASLSGKAESGANQMVSVREPRLEILEQQPPGGGSPCVTPKTSNRKKQASKP